MLHFRKSVAALAVAASVGEDVQTIIIRADKNLEYAKVQDAVDIAAKAGVRVTGLISEQFPGSEGKSVDDQKGGS